MSKRKLYFYLLILSLVLIFGGSYLANKVQTADGDVVMRSINFVTEDGINLHALLYIPNSATNKNPAPAIVSSHGYNNTAEVQAINAVELSRRGYVVIAIDAYWHGLSGGTSVNVDNNNIVPDMGGYAALQYLGTLPFVDKEHIGMVGHSMGCAVIQGAALRAFKNHDTNPSIIIPKALLLTSNAYATNAEKTKLAYADYPVNVGTIFGQFDEWSENMFGPEGKIGKNVINTPIAVAGMGFAGAKADTFYEAGINKPLTREEAIESAKNNTLRVFYQPPTDHPQVHFSSLAAMPVIEYFDITLSEGNGSIPNTDLVWYWKEIYTFTAMIGFLLFVIPFTFLMLETPYFKAIVRPEPVAPTTMNDGKSKRRYWLIYLICLLPAPLLFYWAVGYPIDIVSLGRAVPIVLKSSTLFPMPAINGIVVVCVLIGAFLLALFTAVYKIYMKPAGVKYQDIGAPFNGQIILRSALLAILVFFATYMTLVLSTYFFNSDFRLFVFSVKTLSAAKWSIFLSYLVPFLFFYLIASLTLNSFTRVRGASEWKNMLLMIVAMCGGYIVLFLLDYTGYYYLGHKLFMYVPFFSGNLTTALAGLFVWNMIFILPVATIYARLCFRKTGSIWLGGFICALIMTLFSVSNTVIAAGQLY